MTPLSEGSAQVTFIRQRKEQEAAVNEDNIEITESANNAETTGSAAEDSEAVSRDNEDESGPVPEAGPGEDTLPEDIPEDVNSADELYEQFLERYRVKDVLSEITFQFVADHSGKRGKLILSEVKATEQEHRGVMESADPDFSYKLWEDSSGMLQMSLPVVEEGWETSWKGEYIAPEDPDIPGITISEPEKEGGRYVILHINSNGVIEDEQNYSIQGLAQGRATLQFTGVSVKRRIIVEVEISSDGVVTVLSHRSEAL